MNAKSPLFQLVRYRENHLISRYLLVKRKLESHYLLFLRRRIKKDNLRMPFGQRGRAASLLYFLIRRRFKKERRMRVPRLKAVH